MFNISLDRPDRYWHYEVERVQLPEGNMYIVACYLTYLVLSLIVTVWVAHTLQKNGRVFLVDTFHGNTELADSVNHLLVVGFYLINIGYVALALRTNGNLATVRESIELVSDKMGIVLLVLGGMHFFNLFVFSRMRKRSRLNAPPFPPSTNQIPGLAK